jgi:hypothetical protein
MTETFRAKNHVIEVIELHTGHGKSRIAAIHQKLRAQTEQILSEFSGGTYPVDTLILDIWPPAP